MTIDYTEFEFFISLQTLLKVNLLDAECQRVYTSLDEDR